MNVMNGAAAAKETMFKIGSQRKRKLGKLNTKNSFHDCSLRPEQIVKGEDARHGAAVDIGDGK